AGVSAFLEAFLREYDVEMETTRRMLARVPESGLSWKPHAKSKTLGELATHVTELPRWGVRLKQDSFVVGSETAPPMKSAEELLARFDHNVAENRAAIAAMTDSELPEEFTVLRDGQVFFKLNRRIMLRRVLLNHMIHHRGQLSVYLRHHDVPLPPV